MEDTDKTTSLASVENGKTLNATKQATEDNGKDMLLILKANEEIIRDHINKLKDDLVQANGKYIRGERKWAYKPVLDEMIHDILLEFVQHFHENSSSVDERDFSSFIDVLLSNVYSLSRNKNSEEILNIALDVSRNIKSNTEALKEHIEQGFCFKYCIKPKKQLEQEILPLKALLENVKRGVTISDDTIDALLETTYNMSTYLQIGFVTSLFMLGEICSTLRFSLMLKENLDVWKAISDYCHKIFESGEVRRYTYVMPSDSIPPVTICIPDFLKGNKKMFMLFEELSAVALCLSTCGNEKTKEERQEKKERLRYVPHKLYNSGQNDLAIEFLENNNYNLLSSEEKLQLKCLLYFTAGHYKAVAKTYEGFPEKQIPKGDYRLKSAYMLSKAMLYKFECKFYKDMEKNKLTHIKDCLKKLKIRYNKKKLEELKKQYSESNTKLSNKEIDIKVKLHFVLEKLVEPNEQKNQPAIAKEYFNSNILFVWYCFKMCDEIINYKPAVAVEKSNPEHVESFQYFQAFARLEKFHTDKFKSEPDDKIDDLLSDFSEDSAKQSDLSEAYHKIINIENANLFLRSTRFLNVAPKNIATHKEFRDWLKCLYFVFLTFKIQDRLAIHSDTLKNKTIGTYMPLERYRQNIVETKVHMLPLLSAATMNDPMEGEVLKFNNQPKSDWLNDPRVYIRALSTLKDNLPMWDRYADDGKGVYAVISKDMLYRSNTNLSPRNINEYYNGRILRLEDSRKMYRVAYLRPTGEKPENIQVTYVGGFAEQTEETETGEKQIDVKSYCNDLNNLLKKYVILGKHLLEKTKCQCTESAKCETQCERKIPELVRYYHNKIKYLFKSYVFESEDEIRLISFNFSSRENIKLPDRYLHYVYWERPLKIDHIVIGPRVKDFRDLIPYLEYSVLETKKSIFMSEISTKNVTRSKVDVI